MTTRSRIIARLALPRAADRVRQERPWLALLAMGVAPLVLPALLLLFWQIATAALWLPPQILPSPATVAKTFADLVTGGDIAANLLISLKRILLGFALGAGSGFALGFALGRSPRLEQYLGPSIRAVAQVPSLGWLPLLMLVFGLGEALNIVIIAKAAFVPMVLGTSAGIRNVPRAYLEVAQAFRLRRTTFIGRVLLPAALPTIFSGVRLALSHAWVAMVIVEMLADSEGVGYMMSWGRTLFQIDIVIVGMVLIGVIGFLMDRGLGRIEARLQRWAPAADRANQ